MREKVVRGGGLGWWGESAALLWAFSLIEQKKSEFKNDSYKLIHKVALQSVEHWP